MRWSRHDRARRVLPPRAGHRASRLLRRYPKELAVCFLVTVGGALSDRVGRTRD
ncbi:hypothetical protein [Terrabacter sp. MAHUQ-38]|uniref:hypothetical protein n=1 Tax=unclassified Terrabacter TaxID=2630222 RepID=UPI00165DA2E9|nr:hypothetical protein [Terrabacter sp. MAHUQ-38]MBC9820125.1 hypothetical protein [Terrabacter sp. MAHUQ-38]